MSKCLILRQIICHLGEVFFFSFFSFGENGGFNPSSAPKSYGDAALSEIMCGNWFFCFKDGDFELSVHLKEKQKTFEDPKLQIFLEQNHRCASFSSLLDVNGKSTARKTPMMQAETGKIYS